jgi:hypothetical protein
MGEIIFFEKLRKKTKNSQHLPKVAHPPKTAVRTTVPHFLSQSKKFI